VFVLNNDEKTCIKTELFDASSQRGLCIDGQIIGVNEYDCFKKRAVVGLYIRFGEKLELVAYEFDSFSVRTIDNHDV
jgi:hypothetical protein